jgi:hypothetical protein
MPNWLGQILHRSLKLRWEETNPQDKTRTLWDVALVEAYLRPDLVKAKAVKTPPESVQRLVTVYTSMDGKRVGRISGKSCWRRVQNSDANTRACWYKTEGT